MLISTGRILTTMTDFDLSLYEADAQNRSGTP